jgi:ParB family chromosome partitioning protein
MPYPCPDCGTDVDKEKYRAQWVHEIGKTVCESCYLKRYGKKGEPWPCSRCATDLKNFVKEEVHFLLDDNGVIQGRLCPECHKKFEKGDENRYKDQLATTKKGDKKMPKQKTFKAATKDCFLFEPEKLVLITDKESPYYDPRVEGKADSALVDSIIAQGVIKPIVVTKDTEGNAIVVDGRQRVKAALAANKKLVADGSKPVRVPGVYRSGSQKALVGVSVSANEIRRDDDILIKSKKAQNLVDMGYTRDEIATTFGVTQQTIGNWLAVDELCEPVKAEIRDGSFAASYAPKLAKLEEKEQIAEMKRLQKEKAVKKPRGKKGAQDKAEKAAKSPETGLRSLKEINAMTKALGKDHRFVRVLDWVTGEDIDLTLYECEECVLGGRDGAFITDVD